MPKKSFLTTKQITLVAMFIAMAVILKSVLVIETGSFRFTFYDIPMMVIGIVFGPFIGGITGIIVDFFHMMFSPWAFTFSVFTLSNMVWAIIPGVLLFGKKLERNRLVITIVIASILAFGLNTIGIVQFQGMGAMIATLYYRIGVLLIKLPIQVMAIEVIYERVLIKQLNLIKTK